MSDRTTTVQNVCVDGSGVPQTGQQVTLTLLVPGSPGTNTAYYTGSGDAITQPVVTAVTDASTGAWSKAVASPQDLTPAGCVWQIVEPGGRVTLTSSFAYSGSPITVSTTWYNAPTTLGKLKMFVRGLNSDATADVASLYVIVVNAPTTWTGGIGAGQWLLPTQSQPYSRDNAGVVSVYLPRQSELSTTGSFFTIRDQLTGAFLTFTVPTAYTNDAGVYNAGTTYALNAVVRRAADDVPFISLAAGNVGNALTDAAHWAPYAGENLAIPPNRTGVGPPGQQVWPVFGGSGTGHSTGLVPDPGGSAGTTRYLREDETWAVPAGGAGGTVTSVTGTAPIAVATGTTTPVISISNTPTFTGEVQASDFKPSGLTGAGLASRYVGAVASGAPTTGTFLLGDWVIDQTGRIWICTTAGSPGTWTAVSGGGGGGSAVLKFGATLTASYTVTGAEGYNGFLIDATSANVTVTLPTAVGASQLYAFARVDDGTSGHSVTLLGSGGQNIDESATLLLRYQYQSLMIASNNVKWLKTGGFTPSPLAARGGLPTLNAAGSLYQVAVSGTNGRVLTEDSGQPGGFSWQVSAGGGGGGSGELLVQDGVSAPPVALYLEDGSDFVWAG